MAKVVVETNGAREAVKEAKNKIDSGIQWVKENPWVIASVVGGIIVGSVAYKNVKLSNELKTLRKEIGKKPALYAENVKRRWYQRTPMTEDQFNALTEAMEPAFEQTMKALGIEYLDPDGRRN